MTRWANDGRRRLAVMVVALQAACLTSWAVAPAALGDSANAIPGRAAQRRRSVGPRHSALLRHRWRRSAVLLGLGRLGPAGQRPAAHCRPALADAGGHHRGHPRHVAGGFRRLRSDLCNRRRRALPGAGARIDRPARQRHRPDRRPALADAAGHDRGDPRHVDGDQRRRDFRLRHRHRRLGVVLGLRRHRTAGQRGGAHRRPTLAHAGGHHRSHPRHVDGDHRRWPARLRHRPPTAPPGAGAATARATWATAPP